MGHDQRRVRRLLGQPPQTARVSRHRREPRLAPLGCLVDAVRLAPLAVRGPRLRLEEAEADVAEVGVDDRPPAGQHLLEALERPPEWRDDNCRPLDAGEHRPQGPALGTAHLGERDVHRGIPVQQPGGVVGRLAVTDEHDVGMRKIHGRIIACAVGSRRGSLRAHRRPEGRHRRLRARAPRARHARVDARDHHDRDARRRSRGPGRGCHLRGAGARRAGGGGAGRPERRRDVRRGVQRARDLRHRLPPVGLRVGRARARAAPGPADAGWRARPDVPPGAVLHVDPRRRAPVARG